MKSRRPLGIVLAALAPSLLLPLPATADPPLTGDDYARAESILSHHLGNTVKNEEPAAHWIGSQDQFWYRRDGAAGSEYVVVDAATGTKRPVFDHRRLAEAIDSLAEDGVVAFVAQASVEPPSDRVSSLAEKRGDIASSQTVARDSEERELDPPTDALLGSKPRGQVVESVPGCPAPWPRRGVAQQLPPSATPPPLRCRGDGPRASHGRGIDNRLLMGGTHHEVAPSQPSPSIWRRSMLAVVLNGQGDSAAD